MLFWVMEAENYFKNQIFFNASQENIPKRLQYWTDFFTQFLLITPLLFSTLQHSPPSLAPMDFLGRFFFFFTAYLMLFFIISGVQPLTNRTRPTEESCIPDHPACWRKLCQFGLLRTFQNDIFSALIIIVIEKWLMRWRPETNFKGTQGPEQSHAAFPSILSSASRKLPDWAHLQKSQPQIIKLLSGLATRFMLKICGMPFFAWQN